ncbi:TD and POZ domain-containing protein 4 [Trichonephila inaurata madagascariensis]|uniref:TD and POZ domain-containing protein 4 n=1 Tax=Trichonephila inaurata madagascariensis TaxID=2747483 RepID=A0A8X6YL32_9ARAC|nr:TD and POZ domain-containing protein 4 [Trichonephila inaurata madagascariensis]
MVTAVNSEGAFFTYIWVIENFSREFLHIIKSPSFLVERMQKTTWHLILFESSGYIRICIAREATQSGPESIKTTFEFSVLDTSGCPLNNRKQNTNCFKEGDYFDCPFSQVLDEIGKKWNEFLPNGSLTIRFQMWIGERKSSKTDLCFARTVLGLERKAFIWSIREFKSLQPGQKRSIHLNPAIRGGPAPVLSISIRKREQDSVAIDLSTGSGLKGYILEYYISLLDTEGKVTDTFPRIIDFYSRSTENFTVVNISIKKLMTGSYLLNDVLTLKCKYVIRFGVVSSLIEDYRRFSGLAAENVVPDLSVPCCSSYKNFMELYQGVQYDIDLRAGSESFPVHKTFLSIRSSVFRFMFSSGATETRSRMFQPLFSRGVKGMRKVVDVYDVDADTLCLLLHYIYTDTVEDLPIDSAISLYTAANRYKLMNLKDRCSTILKEKICKCSIGKILELANSYDDRDIKIAVNHFIFLHRNDVCGWEDMKMSMQCGKFKREGPNPGPPSPFDQCFQF